MTPPPSDNNGSPWGNSGKRPSGGGSGGNPNNPWNQQGGPGGPGPFGDWAAVKRFGQSLINDFMGGHMGGGKTFIILGMIIVVLWGLSGIFQVSATQLGIVMRFGEAQRVESPGLRYHLPYPIEDVILTEVTSAQRVAVGYQSDDLYRRGAESNNPNESMMLTGDENIIEVSFDVMWQVDPIRVKDFVFNIKDPALTVKAVAESAMREVIGQSNIQTAITSGRDKIEIKTLELLQKTLDQYQTGILVTQINLRGANAPAEVADAFQDVTRARSDKETKINQADTYRNKIIPEAEGQAARMMQEASAYKEQIVNQANGNAQRFLSVYQSYQNAREVTARQMYLDTMETVLKDSRKVIVDPSLKGVAAFLPLGNLLSAPQKKEE